MSSASDTKYGDPNKVLPEDHLHKGTDWNHLTVGRNHGTALILAIEQGNLDLLCELLKDDTVDVNCPDEYGTTALIMAIRKENVARQNGCELPGSPRCYSPHHGKHL